jgi:hypothetical protein
MNLLETVLDYMLQTTVVVTALEYFRANRWNDIRTLDDLDGVLARYPEDQDGNTALAVHLWGYRFWTRAQQLRDLVRYFRSIGVVDRESLRSWAHASRVQARLRGSREGTRPCRLSMARDAPGSRHRQARRSRAAVRGGIGRPSARRSGSDRPHLAGCQAARHQSVRIRLANLGSLPRRRAALSRAADRLEAVRSRSQLAAAASTFRRWEEHRHGRGAARGVGA